MMLMTAATVYTHLRLATLCEVAIPYGLVEDGAVVVENGKVVWAGAANALPSDYAGISRHDLEGALVTPALIDCHTHIVFGGNRAAEFEMRLNGASYQEIASRGGGITTTVNSTRAARMDELVDLALPRVDAMISEGVATIEVKSGYGLDQVTELNMLRAARKLAQARPVNIVTTFLGAHSVPPEFIDDPDSYIGKVCIPALREAHAEGLVDAVDGFCENIAFCADQLDRVFSAASQLGIPVRIHAEQLSHSGGTQLLAKYKGLSADHMEYANADDARALGAAGSCAVLLPGAYYTLGESRRPPVEALRQNKVPIAVATDCNPGSSPLASPVLAMNMACTLFNLTPQEALVGFTRNAARALGLKDRGEIRPGMRADLAIWNIEHPSELSYRIGFNPLRARIFGGRFDPV